ncbi:hypothetical protein SAMN02910339_01368 [Lachnospiraceae bacterium YSD2013]|nr:hypothetical protein SAMN02910339_01368 [Lachnospiraceae bacterium YSD2013]
MSNIYISSFDEDSLRKWGLFYDDIRGNRQKLTENFKHLAFDTEQEAKKRLKDIEQERTREDNAVAFPLEEAKAFAERFKWKYATTYAKTAPHEYLVKSWLSEDDKLLYEHFVKTIKEKAVVGFFYEHKNNYLILGDYYYWFMYTPDNMAVDLINRTTTNYLEYRDGAYHYKPQGEK